MIFKPGWRRWRPFLCRIGLHKWRWPFPSEAMQERVRCERCAARKLCVRGAR